MLWGLKLKKAVKKNIWKSIKALKICLVKRWAVFLKTGDRTYCYIGIWESEEAIAAQRDAMIANLDKMRHVLEELSPELGVTDPVSGTVVLDYDG